jgi:hypothetical protein
MSGPIPVGEIIVTSEREKMLRSESNADANRHEVKPFEYRTSNSKVERGQQMRFRRLLVLILQAGAFVGNGSIVCVAQPASESGQDVTAMRRADALVKQMTFDEKLHFIVSKYPNNADPGGGAGYIEGIPRLGIPDINISDSATGSGSTKQPSSTFPATIALAASWDRQLSFDYGARLRVSCAHRDLGWAWEVE